MVVVGDGGRCFWWCFWCCFWLVNVVVGDSVVVGSGGGGGVGCCW